MRQEEIIDEICSATVNVFSTMLSTDVVAGPAANEEGVPGPTEGVVSLIGLAGTWMGTGSMSCDSATACRLSGQFLMTEFASVTEDVLDAIGELTNMIIGNFKTRLEEKLGPMGLSVPTVIYGRNFTTRSLSTKSWTLVPFESEFGRFDVHICVAPDDTSSQRHPRRGTADLHPVAG